MKKKLTINTLALGNLKQRRKQYTIMIIGIILAMVFSSSIVFFMFSATETSNEERAQQRGKQSSIIYSEQLGEKEYNLVTNNCEHFAIWCKTGVSESSQVDKVLQLIEIYTFGVVE